MTSLAWDGGRLSLMALALGWGIGLFSGRTAMAYGEDDGPIRPGKMGHHHWRKVGPGTLGYGGNRTYQGFQGFGLSYHPGYGYGGYALGVGAEGGYPCYGGPGYPHPAPPLRRFGRLLPYSYNGGPGYPREGGSHYFSPVGPLVAGREVVSTGIDRRDPTPSSDYGPFTGTLPYPDWYFAPYSAAAARGGTSDGSGPPIPPSGPPIPPSGPPIPPPGP